MWPLAECISSTLVRTQVSSLVFFNLYDIHSNPSPILLFHLVCSYLWWKPERLRTNPSLSITWPKLSIREWTPLQPLQKLHVDLDALTGHSPVFLGCLPPCCASRTILNILPRFATTAVKASILNAVRSMFAVVARVVMFLWQFACCLLCLCQYDSKHCVTGLATYCEVGSVVYVVHVVWVFRFMGWESELLLLHN